MKFIQILLIVFSVNFISADSEKLDPIIFMLDLSVVDSKNEEARKFTYEITKKVIANEPDTVIYQYFFGPDNKVFLYEVYKLSLIHI